VETVSDAIENDAHAIGIFLDLRKAFDTVNHNILIDKLHHYGIRGVALKFLKSYLSGRRQFVSFEGITSTALEIKCGVPQGSILGPILFLIYINDLCQVSKVLNAVLFADDTNFVFINKNIQEMILNVNFELQKINTWFIVNKLTLNVNKSNYVIFGKRKFLNDEAIKIDEIVLSEATQVTFLGIILDKNLTWKPQITNIEKKVARAIGIMYHVKDLLDKKCLCTLYYSFVYPYISYCCQIWGNTYATKLNKIVVLQKRAIRVIAGLGFRDSTSKTFYDLSFLKFHDVVKLETSLFAFKASKILLPAILQEKYSERKNIGSTRNTDFFYIKVFKKHSRLMCPSIQGAKLFNSLPKNIANAKTISSFKFLFKKYCKNEYRNN
jgi:hypothetical protein